MDKSKLWSPIAESNNVEVEYGGIELQDKEKICSIFCCFILLKVQIHVILQLKQK